MLFSSRSVVIADPSNTFGELAIPLQINQYKSFTHINIERIAYHSTNTKLDDAMAKSSASALVGTGFVYQNRLQPREEF